MKRVAIVFALLVVFVIGAGFVLAWSHDRSGYQNTAYSVSYSRDAFNHLTVGTPRSNVVAALGVPLSTRVDPSYPADTFGDEVVRRFGSHSNITVEFLYFSKPKDQMHDFHWVQVCIGPDTTVVGTSSYITD